jgi:predicted dehydrogenase
MQPVKLGIIGCGVISDAYLKGAGRSKLVAVKSCTDLLPATAAAKAANYDIAAVGIEELLADPEIEIVINLTVPLAHAEVSLRAVAAGKHVYSEKPIATTLAEGQKLTAAARAKGVRLGAAPDTFLGASHQAVRRAVDAGRLGRVVAGGACFATHGPETWHPNPGFFYKRGAGPVLDIGPYPVTQLVNLLGPVESVTAHASRGFPTRTVTSEPRAGEIIEVEVPTMVNGALAFANGANVGLTVGWEVWKHTREPIELYGSEGSLINPDPNFFGGTPRLSERNGAWQELPIEAHPFGAPNRQMKSGAMVADYRILGVLDMAQAIREGRPHRANGDLALHVLEVLQALERSSIEGQRIRIETICERPEALPLGHDEAVFVTTPAR